MKKWWLLLLLVISYPIHGQTCAQIQQFTVNNQTRDTVCVGSQVQFLIKGKDFPQGGVVDWYLGTTSGFDPLTQGTWIDSTTIGGTTTSCPSRCPDITAIMFNSCGGSNEPGNEYILLNSGDGFNVDDLQVDLPNNFATDNSSGDIHLSSIAPNICGFRVPESFIKNSIITGSCNSSNVIAAGPGDIIPSDAWVIIFTSTGVTVTYDFQSLCQTGNKVYILQSNCTRNGGAFTNSASCGNSYTTNIYLDNCPCSDALTIDRCNLSNSDGEYARDIGVPISSVANGGILVNNPPCSSPPYSSLKPIESTVLLNWTVPQNLCDKKDIFIKAVINPHGACNAVISGNTELRILCTAIAIEPIATQYCTDATLPIVISNADPIITYSYSINTSGNITASLLSSPTDEKQDIKVNAPRGSSGRLDLTITATAAGCQNSKLYSYFFDNNIISGLPDKISNCTGSPITLTANAGYDSYLWNTGVAARDITVSQSGTYIVTIKQGSCTAKDTVEVILGQGLSYTSNVISPTCHNGNDGSIAITVLGGEPPVKILWNTSSTDFTIQNLVQGEYYFTITENGGCSTKDTIYLSSPLQLKATLGITNPTCFGEENGEIVLSNIQHAQGNVSTSLNNASFTNTLNYTQLPQGEYSVILKDDAGCSIKFDTLIVSPEPISIILPENIDAAPGEVITLSPSLLHTQGSVKYVWSPATGLSCSTCLSPKVSTEDEITYTITVKDSKGCTAMDSVRVRFFIPHIIDIATAFDPSSKNKNNKIYILGNRYIKAVHTFKIFNRWGVNVFEVNDVPVNNSLYGWNGIYKGELQPQDTYIFYVEVEFIDGFILQDKGTFLLIR